MADPYYVKFETPADMVPPIYEALRVASQGGKVKKGTNEVTKSIERGTAKLVVIARDVEPPELVAHLPILCDEQGADYAYVPTKQELGKALGIDITAAAASIVDAAEAQHIVDEVVASVKKARGGQKAQ